MLNLLEDDSTYSFIYRTNVIHGIFDYANIIAKNGQWKRHPQISSKTLHLYMPMNETMLLNCLQKVGLGIQQSSLFGNPIKHLHELRVFFGKASGQGGIRVGTLQITYCLHCIREQLLTKGHAWFKSAWLYSTICSIHNKSLTIIISTDRNETVEALTKVFSGDHPNKYEIVVEKNKNSNKFRGYNDPHTPKQNSTPVALCLQIELRRFLILHQIEVAKFLADIGLAVPPAIFTSNSYFFQKYISNQNVIEKILKELIRREPAFFYYFWVCNTIEVDFNCGILNRKSLTQKIRKVINLSCDSFCPHTSCVKHRN